jgi:hypothetical protein
MTSQTDTMISTAGGTATATGAAILASLPVEQIILSALLGTVVSFLVTELLKWLKSKFINKNGKIN